MSKTVQRQPGVVLFVSKLFNVNRESCSLCPKLFNVNRESCSLCPKLFSLNRELCGEAALVSTLCSWDRSGSDAAPVSGRAQRVRA